MYMRISWVQTEPGQATRYVDEFSRIQIQGNMRSVRLGQVQDNPDSLYIVTLWDSLEDIQAWESSRDYLEDFNPRLKPFILGNYSVSVCEVVFDQVKPS